MSPTVSLSIIRSLAPYTQQ